MLREEIGLRYKKVSNQFQMNNSPRLKLIRLKQARVLLDAIQKDMRIINIDESALS